MEIQELVKFLNKKYETIEKAIWKMIKVHSNYRYVVNNEFVITKEGIELKDGKLADIAPTMLELLEMPIPEEMTGESLIK